MGKRKRRRPLSGTVEGLLADFVAAAEARKREESAALAAVIAGLNAFNDRHGFMSDEFLPL